jgi:transposase
MRVNMWYTYSVKTQDTRSLPPAAQEDLRRKAINAVLAGGKVGQVAALFGVSRQALYTWRKAYEKGGARALRARRRGRPKGGELLPWQAAQIARAVVDHHPDQLKLPFYLWTRQAVRELIASRFGIDFSLTTVGRYLKRWGFTPQKPVRRAFEQNPKAVRAWLEDEYPAIRQQAKREKAAIYWADEMGLRSDHAVGRTYGRRGQTPVVPGTGQRFGCNLISAISNLGRLCFLVFAGHLTAAVLVDFLGRLVRQASRKVFVILDRHPVHRSKEVRAWLAEHAGEIRLFYLPPYSPELNPDEMLNNDVKSNAVGRRRARTREELVGDVERYLHKRQRQPRVVERYFDETHVRYAAR